MAHTAVAIDIDGEMTETTVTHVDVAAHTDGRNNMYQIFIMVTERRASGLRGSWRNPPEIGVTVSVMEVNEQGTITLDALQPEVRVPARTITADLVDEDTGRTDSDVTWQWARSKVQQPSITSSAHWEVISGTVPGMKPTVRSLPMRTNSCG